MTAELNRRVLAALSASPVMAAPPVSGARTEFGS
jgi:hypothetical protein